MLEGRPSGWLRRLFHCDPDRPPRTPWTAALARRSELDGHKTSCIRFRGHIRDCLRDWRRRTPRRSVLRDTRRLLSRLELQPVTFRSHGADINGPYSPDPAAYRLSGQSKGTSFAAPGLSDFVHGFDQTGSTLVTQYSVLLDAAHARMRAAKESAFGGGHVLAAALSPAGGGCRSSAPGALERQRCSERATFGDLRESASCCGDRQG